MNHASTRRQRGGAIGTLIVLILVAVGGYYLYVEMFAGESRPLSCKEASQACFKNCRRTSTDQASITACQNECQRKLDACK